MPATKKTEIGEVEEAFQDLISWSPQGVTATLREAPTLQMTGEIP
jgi:hypothetical protein